LGARISFIAVLVSLVAIVGAPAASAQLTVGQNPPPGIPPRLCEFESAYDEVQVQTAAGNSYVVPVAGVLTSWTTVVGPATGQAFGLKVYRPLGGEIYQVIGVDGPRALVPGTANTFPVNIPVVAGDVLGVVLGPNSAADCVFDTGLSQDIIRFHPGNDAVGSSNTFGNFFESARLNISATLLPPPVITALTPAEGPIKGAKVVIAGANFASVSAVSFGGIPAKSFTVDSEAQISAVAPNSSKLVKAAVGVTTIAGTAGAPTTFAYEGCKVPKLKNKKLKAVKKQAKKADCKIGKVKKQGDATAKTGEVVKQNPKPGQILLPGAQIKVTLGE
jgi:hypothetical protein